MRDDRLLMSVCIFLVCCLAAVAGEATVIKYSHRILDGAPADLAEELELTADRLCLNNQSIAFVRGNSRFLVDLERRLFCVINDEEKLYTKVSLDGDLTAILTPVSLLRYANGAFRTGVVSQTESAGMLMDLPATRYQFVDDDSRVNISWTVTQDPGVNTSKYEEAISLLRRFDRSDYDAASLVELSKIAGIPLRMEYVRQRGNRTIHVVQEATSVQKVDSCEELTLAPGYREKGTISWREYFEGFVEPWKQQFTKDEIAIRSVLANFQQGYVEADLDAVDAWAEEIMTDDVFIIGTDGPFPGTREWACGLDAARQAFASDWSRFWKSLRLYDEESYLSVEGNAAWYVGFATVTRPGNDADMSRKRSLNRIRSYTEEDWSSRRALYEIIADASQVLVQYERAEISTYIIRLQLDFVNRDGRWLIRMVNFSHPARGFRSWNLTTIPESLKQNQ